jgi:Cysteine rich repeat
LTHPGYRTFAALFVLSALAITLPAVANAQTTAQQACKADYQRLCAGVSPGGGRIVACLQSHPEQLSPACKDALAKAGK